MPVDDDQLRWMLQKMCLIRAFEEKVLELFQEGNDLIRGPVHSYIGEEAVAVGACAALRDDDVITSTHRGHGHCLAKGGDPKLMMAELFGKATGYCKGKGGSMHIAAVDKGILGANGVVGGSVGIAGGAALAHKYRGTDGVAVCFFGDGAMNQGIFHEAATIAALWKLPVIFLCEDNGFAQYRSGHDFKPVRDLALRATSYGFPGVNVDGNNVEDVYKTVNASVERSRAGGGPTLIIAETYRVMGHTVLDAGVYRTEAEVEEWQRKDPIKQLRERMVGSGVISEEVAGEVEQNAKTEIEQAVDFAEISPQPELDELYSDVYV